MAANRREYGLKRAPVELKIVCPMIPATREGHHDRQLDQGLHRHRDRRQKTPTWPSASTATRSASSTQCSMPRCRVAARCIDCCAGPTLIKLVWPRTWTPGERAGWWHPGSVWLPVLDDLGVEPRGDHRSAALRPAARRPIEPRETVPAWRISDGRGSRRQLGGVPSGQPGLTVHRAGVEPRMSGGCRRSGGIRIWAGIRLGIRDESRPEAGLEQLPPSSPAQLPPPSSESSGRQRRDSGCREADDGATLDRGVHPRATVRVGTNPHGVATVAAVPFMDWVVRRGESARDGRGHRTGGGDWSRRR